MRSLAEVLKMVNDYPDKRARIAGLASLAPRYMEPAKMVLRYALDPRIKFDLTEDIPYEKSDFDEPGILFNELKRLHVFVEGLNPNLTRARRDELFGELLSAVAHSDAEMLDAMRRKRLPWPNLTKEVVLRAFPGLLS